MPSVYLGNLIARRDAIAQELNDLDATKPGGAPNVSGAGPQPNHSTYKNDLYKELLQLEELIAAASEREGEAYQQAPFMVKSRGV